LHLSKRNVLIWLNGLERNPLVLDQEGRQGRHLLVNGGAGVVSEGVPVRVRFAGVLGATLEVPAVCVRTSPAGPVARVMGSKVVERLVAVFLPIEAVLLAGVIG